MSRVDYKSTSPYADTPQTSWFLGNYVAREILRDGTDRLRVLESKYEFRPDLLSYDLFGTPNLWWVFMVLNPNQIRDPIYDFRTGLSIYTPTASRLSSLLGT